MNKLRLFLIILVLSCSIIEHPLFPGTDNGNKNDYTTINDSLIEEDSTPTFYYIFDNSTSDGYEVQLTDGSKYQIGWWYRSAPKRWKKGDRLTVALTANSSNGWKLTNIESGEIVWGEPVQLASSYPKIKKIKPQSKESDGFSKLYLTNDLAFKGKDPGTFENMSSWQSGDEILILHSENNHTFTLYNFNQKELVLEASLVNIQTTFNIDNSFENIILSLEDKLNARVLQQPEATFAVTMALFNYVSGLKSKEQPIAVFLFLGPTGVGKTELAKSLNAELYKDPQNLTRFDMSQFADEYNLTRLIGSPPGYSDHENGGQLTNALRERPQSIVLLDEMEKAHDKVRKAFLPIFDEGQILDADNEPVDCTEVIFIMTSNLAGPEIAELHMMGYSPDEILEIIEPKIMKELSPELYNRVTPVTFEPLMPESMPALVELMLKGVKARLLTERNIRLKIDETALEYFAEKGYHPQLGARPLKRLIEKKVTTLISIAIVKKEIGSGDLVTVHYSAADDAFFLAVEPEAAFTTN